MKFYFLPKRDKPPKYQWRSRPQDQREGSRRLMVQVHLPRGNYRRPMSSIPARSVYPSSFQLYFELTNAQLLLSIPLVTQNHGKLPHPPEQRARRCRRGNRKRNFCAPRHRIQAIKTVEIHSHLSSRLRHHRLVLHRWLSVQLPIPLKRRSVHRRPLIPKYVSS